MLLVCELLNGSERIVSGFEERDGALHERNLCGKIIVVRRKRDVQTGKNGVDGGEGGENRLFRVGKAFDIVNEGEKVSSFFENVAALGKRRKPVLDRDVEEREIVLGEMHRTGGEVFIDKKVLAELSKASRVVAREAVEIG